MARRHPSLDPARRERATRGTSALALLPWLLLVAATLLPLLG